MTFSGKIHAMTVLIRNFYKGILNNLHLGTLITFWRRKKMKSLKIWKLSTTTAQSILMKNSQKINLMSWRTLRLPLRLSWVTPRRIPSFLMAFLNQFLVQKRLNWRQSQSSLRMCRLETCFGSNRIMFLTSLMCSRKPASIQTTWVIPWPKIFSHFWLCGARCLKKLSAILPT